MHGLSTSDRSTADLGAALNILAWAGMAEPGHALPLRAIWLRSCCRARLRHEADSETEEDFLGLPLDVSVHAWSLGSWATVELAREGDSEMYHQLQAGRRREQLADSDMSRLSRQPSAASRNWHVCLMAQVVRRGPLAIAQGEDMPTPGPSV